MGCRYVIRRLSKDVSAKRYDTNSGSVKLQSRDFSDFILARYSASGTATISPLTLRIFKVLSLARYSKIPSRDLL